MDLFHRIAEPASAQARRRVSQLGLERRVAFRNVAFDSHLDALRARGGTGETPALWDGQALHVGVVSVMAVLAAARGEG